MRKAAPCGGAARGSRCTFRFRRRPQTSSRSTLDRRRTTHSSSGWRAGPLPLCFVIKRVAILTIVVGCWIDDRSHGGHAVPVKQTRLLLWFSFRAGGFRLCLRLFRGQSVRMKHSLQLESMLDHMIFFFVVFVSRGVAQWLMISTWSRCVQRRLGHSMESGFDSCLFGEWICCPNCGTSVWFFCLLGVARGEMHSTGWWVGCGTIRCAAGRLARRVEASDTMVFLVSLRPCGFVALLALSFSRVRRLWASARSARFAYLCRGLLVEVVASFTGECVSAAIRGSSSQTRGSFFFPRFGRFAGALRPSSSFKVFFPSQNFLIPEGMIRAARPQPRIHVDCDLTGCWWERYKAVGPLRRLRSLRVVDRGQTSAAVSPCVHHAERCGARRLAFNEMKHTNLPRRPLQPRDKT